MNDYASRRSAADAYLPAQIAILSDVLLIPPTEIMIAPVDIDRSQGIDVLVNDYRVSLRVRSFALLRYSPQFTIRLTEIPKIREGLVDALLYAFGADDDTGSIIRWTLIDLKPLRDAILNNFECVTVIRQPEFYAFPFSAFPPPFVLASSHPLPQPDAQLCDCRRRAALRLARERCVNDSKTKGEPSI